MQFMVYGTRPSKDKSGAYLFLPDGKAKVFTWLCHTFTCLSKAFDRDSPVYTVTVSSQGARGRNSGRLGTASFLLDLKTVRA